jgi:hypothetical protein
MRMVLRRDHPRRGSFGNWEGLFTAEIPFGYAQGKLRHREKPNEKRTVWRFCPGLCASGVEGLFEDAVVQLFAFPVGCGLDEGQDYRVWLLGG